MYLENVALKHPFTGETFRVSTEQIGPGEAQILLKESQEAAGSEAVHNRGLSKPAVQKIAGDLTGGRWTFNGQTIVIDDKGFILDGQHRLQACADSGVPIFSLVVRGLNPKVMPSLDSGRARSRVDILQMSDAFEASALNQALSITKAYREGTLQNRSRSQISNTEILGLLDGPFRSLVDSTQWASEVSKGRTNLLFRSEIAALHTILQDAAPIHMVERWPQELVQGHNLSGNREVLYQKLLRAVVTKQKSQKVTRLERLSYVVKAWNADREGVTVKRFTFVPSRETFPKPV